MSESVCERVSMSVKRRVGVRVREAGGKGAKLITDRMGKTEKQRKKER